MQACETRRAEAMAASVAEGKEAVFSGMPTAVSRSTSFEESLGGEQPSAGADGEKTAKRRKPNTAEYSTLDSADTAAAVPSGPSTVPSGPATASAGATQGTPAAKPDDRFTQELGEVCNRAGGLRDPACAPRFEKLMDGATTLNTRVLLLTVISNSQRAALTALVHGRSLGILELWLNQAREAAQVKFLGKILGCLKKLPVDLQGLKSCTIGKRVSNLSKKGPAEVQAMAAALVASWKKTVEAEQPAAKECVFCLSAFSPRLCLWPPPLFSVDTICLSPLLSLLLSLVCTVMPVCVAAHVRVRTCVRRNLWLC